MVSQRNIFSEQRDIYMSEKTVLKRNLDEFVCIYMSRGVRAVYECKLPR